MLKELTLAIVAVAVPVVTVEAGIWDSIKSTFVSNETPAPPQIRILIVHDTNSSMLEIKGDYNIYDPYKNSKLASRYGIKRAPILSASTGIKWGEEFPGVYQIKIVPDHEKTRTVVNGIEYSGNIYVYDVGGKISIVNEIDIEHYVSAVLSPLFDHTLSHEAMNALAIATRTDAYHLAAHSQNPYWHADAQKVGYMGSAVTHRGNGVDEAVDRTKYMVMSQTSPYRGKITTFPTAVVSAKKPQTHEGCASLSIDEVEKMAQKGNQADKILTHIFPNTSIGLTYHFDQTQQREIAELID